MLIVVTYRVVLSPGSPTVRIFILIVLYAIYKYWVFINVLYWYLYLHVGLFVKFVLLLWNYLAVCRHHGYTTHHLHCCTGMDQLLASPTAALSASSDHTKAPRYQIKIPSCIFFYAYILCTYYTTRSSSSHCLYTYLHVVYVFTCMHYDGGEYLLLILPYRSITLRYF